MAYSYRVFDKGSKIGYHALLGGATTIPDLKLRVQRGIRRTVVKSVDNLGVLVEAKQIDPTVITIARFVFELTDACDNVPYYETGQLKWAHKDLARWTAADMVLFSQIVVRNFLLRVSAAERPAIDFAELINEADPPGVSGYRAYGQLLIALILEANRWGLKVALPAFNAGTPEWDELNAFVETGVVGVLKAHGGIFTTHEGVIDDNQPIAYGSIPGAPTIPGAGPMCFRYRYLYYLLKQRDEVVPLVISECYLGGGHSDVAAVMPRARLFDTEARKDYYVWSVLLYTLGDAAGWPSYAFLYPALQDYAAQINDYANGTLPGLEPIPTPIPQPNPTPLPVVTGQRIVGLHGRADGRFLPSDFQAIATSRAQAVKLTTSAAPEDTAQLLQAKPDILLVVRLFAQFDNRKPSPSDFVNWVKDDLARHWAVGVRYFEVHNEVNLPSEGQGTAWNGGLEFGRWMSEVCRQLRALFPGIQLGFPGLSPQANQAELAFFRDARDGRLAADWIGVHIYWLSAAEMRTTPAQLNGYRVGKPLIVTEFADVSSAPKADKAALYVEFYRLMAAQQDVISAFAFVSSASVGYADQTWVEEASHQLSPIPALVGNRKDTMTNQATVTASLLNEREFPWIGAVTPPLVAQLKAGFVVTVYGSLKLPSMLYGWYCISPDGNRWVSGQWLRF